MDENLIDRIYEAAVLPDLWPSVLDDLASAGKGYCTILFAIGRDSWRWVASGEGVRICEDYIAEG